MASSVLLEEFQRIRTPPGLRRISETGHEPAIQMLILPLFSSERVEARLDEIGRLLYRDYADSPLVMLCVGDGARRFVGSLMDRLLAHRMNCEVEYLSARRNPSFGRAPIQVDAFDPSAWEDRDVLVAGDVADQGAMLRAIVELVELAEPRSIRTAVLVDKRAGRRDPVRIDYAAFVVESGWLVGYGMEVDGEFGDLDEIAIVGPAEPGGDASGA